MSNHRRIWSVAEKLEALQTLEKEGLTKTIRQLDISSTTLYKWQKQFEESGETGLTQKNSQKRDLVHEKLLKENRELKLLVAEKELTIRVLNELVKKNHYPKTTV